MKTVQYLFVQDGNIVCSQDGSTALTRNGEFRLGISELPRGKWSEMTSSEKNKWQTAALTVAKAGYVYADSPLLSGRIDDVVLKIVSDSPVIQISGFHWDIQITVLIRQLTYILTVNDEMVSTSVQGVRFTQGQTISNTALVGNDYVLSTQSRKGSVLTLGTTSPDLIVTQKTPASDEIVSYHNYYKMYAEQGYVGYGNLTDNNWQFVTMESLSSVTVASIAFDSLLTDNNNTGVYGVQIWNRQHTTILSKHPLRPALDHLVYATDFGGEADDETIDITVVRDASHKQVIISHESFDQRFRLPIIIATLQGIGVLGVGVSLIVKQGQATVSSCVAVDSQDVSSLISVTLDGNNPCIKWAGSSSPIIFDDFPNTATSLSSWIPLRYKLCISF